MQSSKTGVLYPWAELVAVTERFTATHTGTPAPLDAFAAGPFSSAGPGVFDLLDLLVPWAEILEPRGFTPVHCPGTLGAWKRPGGTHPVSVKVLHENPHVLVVHSEEAGMPSGGGQKLTKGRVIAHLDYGGDESAAAKALLNGAGHSLTPAFSAAITAWKPAETSHPTAGSGSDEFAVLVEFEAGRIRVREAARRLVDAERRPAAEPFDAGTLAEILRRPAEPQARVQGLLPWESALLNIAQRKSGKTTNLLNLARCLLTGEDYLGRFGVRKLEGDIAFLNYEVSAAQLARWADDVGVPRDRFYEVTLRGRRNPLSDAEDTQRLAATLKARGTETLIVDPFGRAFTGSSQNDAGEVQSFLMTLDLFARSEVGAKDVILSAHAGWNGERTRGSTALEDWADSIVTMTKDDDDVRYLRAIGRDVDVDEDRLHFDPLTRLLTMTGAGSRKQANTARKHDDIDAAVFEAIKLTPCMNGTELGQKLKETISFQRGDERQAAGRLVDAGRVYIIEGKRGAKLYHAVPGR